MIDLHNHILPSLDDGPQSLEEALEMAQMAVADGIHTIFVTPHGPELGFPCTRDEVEARAEELRQALAGQGITLTLLPGVENYIAPDLDRQFEDGRAFTLNGTPYCLVELPLQQYPLYTEEALFRVQVMGLRPILAHPERNAAIQRDPSVLVRLVERGMLAQVTAGSLLGVFGKQAQRTAVLFLRHGLAHILATDAHSSKTKRVPVLSEGVRAAAALIGEEAARDMVTTAPAAIAAGAAVAVAEPEPLSSRKRWFSWRT